MTYGMAIDLRKCVGCHACSVSCKGANATRPGVLRAWVESVMEGSYPDTRITYIPRLCNHCDAAPCVEACPTGASVKRDDGIVSINADECIGCSSCIEACPYGARTLMESEEGYFGETATDYEDAGYAKHPVKTVDKCDFCLSRTPEGEAPQPACVAACPAGARVFGEIDELKALFDGRDEYVLLPDETCGPNVIYLADFKL